MPDNRDDTIESIRNVLQTTLVYTTDPVKNYFFWKQLNGFFNNKGNRKYEIYARRWAVIHLFKGDNHSYVADKLGITIQDVKNDLHWHAHSDKSTLILTP